MCQLHPWILAGFFLATQAFGEVSPGTLNTLSLEGGSSLTGHLLLEKDDSYVVDLGYTVLIVPKSSVLSGKIAGQLNQSEEPVLSSTLLEQVAGIYDMAADPPPVSSVGHLVPSLGEAVVQVRTPGGLGSGFFIHEEGFLITNFHVIENETKISVEVYHQRDERLDRVVYRDVKILAMNKFADLALLKIEDNGGRQFKKLLLGDIERVSVGDPVFGIGSPLGLERSVTEGIISTKTRQIQGSLYLQTNAQINPGNSGGPLFNLRGEVVGVINMKMNFSEGLGFAIPVETVKFFLRNREAFAYAVDNPSNPYRYLEPPGVRSETSEANNN